MTGETRAEISGWTVDTYAAHNEALRSAQDRLDAERDRRYSEVAIERDKASQIEKSARAEALQLAREIQTYKDEKANELRKQIGEERGLYATRSDLISAVEKIEESLKPIQDFVSTARGTSSGKDNTLRGIYALIAAVVAVIGIGTFVFAPPRQVVYVPAPAIGTQK